MEEKNNKLTNILIGVSIGLIISIAGILVYKFYPRSDEVRRNGTVSKQLEIKHTTEDAKTNANDKVVLDEEDVKNWLEGHKIIELYFILNESDFDYNAADKTKFSNILGWCMMFGGLTNNAIENTTLDFNTGYNYQYSYSVDFINKLLTDCFGIKIDMIDTNIMNNNFKGYAHFLIDGDKFTIQVIATGADIFTTAELNDIKLNDNDEIIVNYNMSNCMEYGGECQPYGHRELVLKKTENSYNLLKAYKVD